MNVRIDERGRDEPPFRLENQRLAGIQVASWADGHDAVALDGNIGRFGLLAEGRMDSGVADEEIQGLMLRCPRRRARRRVRRECGIPRRSASSSDQFAGLPSD
jgi:hypothetical protein